MSKNDEKEDKYKPDKGSTYEIMESARKGKKEKKKQINVENKCPLQMITMN